MAKQQNITKKAFWEILEECGYDKNDYARVLNIICSRFYDDAHTAFQKGHMLSWKKDAERGDKIMDLLNSIGYYDDVL